MRKFTVKQDQVDRFLADFNLPGVAINIEPAQQPTIHGEYQFPGIITLYIGARLHEKSSLRMTLSDINRTLLHELRHHWQYHYKRDEFFEPGSRNFGSRIEEDARQFEDEYLGRYSLIRVSTAGSTARRGFASLGRSAR